MIKSQKTLIIIMKSLLNNVLYQNLEELMIFSIISISSSSQLPQCCILHISDSPSRVLCKQNSIEHESMEDTNNCSRFQCKRCISSQGSELPYTHLSYTFSSLTCKSISWSRSSSFVNFSCLPEVCSGRKNSGNFHTHLQQLHWMLSQNSYSFQEDQLSQTDLVLVPSVEQLCRCQSHQCRCLCPTLFHSDILYCHCIHKCFLLCAYTLYLLQELFKPNQEVIFNEKLVNIKSVQKKIQLIFFDVIILQIYKNKYKFPRLGTLNMDLLTLIDKISVRLTQTFNDLHEACQAQIIRQQEMAELKPKQTIQQAQKQSANNQPIPENKQSKESKAKFRKIMNAQRPKKYVEAFALYMKNLKNQLIEKQQNLTAENLIKIATKNWQIIQVKEKQKFHQLEEEGRKKYERQLEEFYSKYPEEKTKNVKSIPKRQKKNQKRVQKIQKAKESEEKQREKNEQNEEDIENKKQKVELIKSQEIEQVKQKQQNKGVEKKQQNDDVNQYFNLDASDSLGQDI